MHRVLALLFVPLLTAAGLPEWLRPYPGVTPEPRRSPKLDHLCSDRVAHPRDRTLARKPQMGKALSSPAPLGRWVTLREHTRVISRECRRAEASFERARHIGNPPAIPPAAQAAAPPSNWK